VKARAGGGSARQKHEAAMRRRASKRAPQPQRPLKIAVPPLRARPLEWWGWCPHGNRYLLLKKGA
jgi:hypothetical protein